VEIAEPRFTTANGEKLQKVFGFLYFPSQVYLVALMDVNGLVGRSTSLEVELGEHDVVQDAVSFVVSVPSLKFSAQVADLQASLLHHPGPPADLLLLVIRRTLFIETTQIQIRFYPRQVAGRLQGKSQLRSLPRRGFCCIKWTAKRSPRGRFLFLSLACRCGWISPGGCPGKREARSAGVTKFRFFLAFTRRKLAPELHVHSIQSREQQKSIPSKLADRYSPRDKQSSSYSIKPSEIKKFNMHCKRRLLSHLDDFHNPRFYELMKF
jgi:hypothetical protein